jgi:hypothetical protein
MSGSQPRYSDEEVIQLAEQNPGYGFRMFTKSLYPNTHRLIEYMYEFTLLFNEYRKFCGVDLIGNLDQPKSSNLVFDEEYLRITGEKQLPVSYGRSKGGRSSKPTRQNPTGAIIKVPLTPQEFHWGDLPTEHERNEREKVLKIVRVSDSITEADFYIYTERACQWASDLGLEEITAAQLSLFFFEQGDRTSGDVSKEILKRVKEFLNS